MKAGFAVVLSLLIGHSPAFAECVRWKPDPAKAPQFDGPGSFGPLHNTVTLDCLRYVGSLMRDGEEWVLIRDDQNVVHRLKVGHSMGENGGVITRIDDQFIYIQQLVRKRGGTDYEPVIVRFAKR